MTLLTNLTVMLVIACISQQFMVANCQGSKKRSEERKGEQRTEQPKPPGPSPDSSSKGNVFKGKFSSDDAFVLGGNCKKKGQTSFDCEYVAQPYAMSCFGLMVAAEHYCSRLPSDLGNIHFPTHFSVVGIQMYLYAGV
uniref:Secreted protein n=1 Tax=Hucho hucho TaxID=62062 RepID=A0A4W5MIW3_9TELE